ncbi:MAG: glycosyl hydrolase [Ferrovibrio sp.]|uniref:glycoside hydrolase family 2 TIM barrel-domain containing protein n=1 Tax=Ferrovibrio sp. TaxID=1917215 RepID=UPI00260AEAB0|nr:glycoside hydrolase family 2 TIM barrel-domain containing protein [Ferrovibrio sp.]MCW0234420.1 glycosyl hydrolase [Ferrovibrio sp.]
MLRILLALFFIAPLVVSRPATAANVSVDRDAILVDGKPFAVVGAAGQTRFGLLKQLGATTVRTYGDETGFVLDEAQKAGLKVIAGFWLEHPRRGFSYRDLAQVGPQLQKLTEFVNRHKNHPALLMWGLGNEVEAELADDSQAWTGIEEAARLVRRLDPHHPTLAVLAEAGNDKIQRLRRHAPSIQVLGVNSYGESLPSLPGRVRAQGWRGPLIITEMGPIGQWQAARTSWGAAIEPSSDEKAAMLSRWFSALQPEVQGYIVFYWGQKQEVTPTWHSLLLSGGEYTRTAEAMAAAWGGNTPQGNRAPRIALFRFPQGNEWNRDQTVRAEIAVEDPDNDPFGVVWQVMAESTDLKTFGDAEQPPPVFPQAIREPGPKGASIAGLQPGNYRLFVTARDGKGAAATANLPFRVK